ncbi:hypothetical protein KFK09_015994 [Dendrobium nobile]|uniref:Uncharacterized protein n=1 Tax=Dendrobium nobile TaxID=94219 RepID=A0A8T3B628_DENNO|nr:hypothetical protein KFK09_015994 [Dendrobium nobile]
MGRWHSIVTLRLKGVKITSENNLFRLTSPFLTLIRLPSNIFVDLFQCFHST